jgi:hypothetical protein
MFKFMPREDSFFDLLERSACNVQKGAEALSDLLTRYHDVELKVKAIKDIEHEGDKLTHELFDRLNKTFITPFDREDIHAIGSRLDDVLDFINTSANRMMLYKIAEPTDDAKELGECLVLATEALCEAVHKLRDMKDVEGMRKLCVVIHTHENTGDRLSHRALARLFETMQAVDIIKWKDIFNDLEAATDRCEDVANVLESVVIKNA